MTAVIIYGILTVAMLVAFLTVIYKLNVVIKNQHIMNLKNEIVAEVVCAIAEKNGIDIDNI